MAWKYPPEQATVGCHPPAVLFHRRRLGWTQAQLAERTGYSQRLIVKAESGRPVKRKTIEDLAAALSGPEREVFPEDLITDPLPLAHEFIFGSYQYLGQTFQQIRHFLDPDILLILSGSPEEIPFAGHHKGLEAVDRALAMFFEIMDVPDQCDYRSTHSFLVNENNPNEVIVWGKSFFFVKHQPRTDPMDLQLRLVFRRGRLVLIDDRFDTHYAKQQFERHVS